MRIAYAIPVKSVERLADGRLMAIGLDTDIHGLDDFPGAITVPLVVSVACPAVETAVEHQLSVRVLGTDLSEVAAPMVMGFTVTPGVNTPPGWDVRLTLPGIIRFDAAGAGTYSIELSIGGESQSVPIIVRDLRVPPPEDGAPEEAGPPE